MSSKEKTKRNLSKSDLENEAADFPRFIIIESFEDVCLAKFSPFLLEKIIAMKATSQKHQENMKWKLVCQGGQLETDQKKWKASTLPSADHISMEDWTLLRKLSEVGSWP